jgi:N-acetylglucosamine-6-phosphate deacetylase
MKRGMTGELTNYTGGTFSVEGVHYATGEPVRIIISDGLISTVERISGKDIPVNMPFLAPGLIDNQVNGCAAVDFSGNALTPSQILTAAKSIWKTGVTTFLPTLITGSHENLKRNFSVFARALEDNELLRDSIPGLHLEGPYISPEAGYRGCHPAEYIRKSSASELDEYIEASGRRIIQVTLAPETEGALELIRSYKSGTIVFAIGHTNAAASQIREAVDAGARLSTHLGNGCANMIHRHNNPIWPQLSDDRLVPSVIADGHHLTPEEINVFFRVKGAGNIILTSDIVCLAGMKPGMYTFLGAEVMLTEEGMLLNVKENCLAGASFPLIKGVENMMNFTGCSLHEALDMASVNVARIYNLDDRAVLTSGKRADIIQFERVKNKIVIRKTWLKGRPVFEA